MSAKYDLIIEQGATFARTFTWKDSAGAAVNITGYSARMKIKTAIGGETIATLTDVSGLTLGGAAGTIAVLISATATAAYTFKRARYDLELVSAGGVVTRLEEGNVILKAEVTT